MRLQGSGGQRVGSGVQPSSKVRPPPRTVTADTSLQCQASVAGRTKLSAQALCSFLQGPPQCQAVECYARGGACSPGPACACQLLRRCPAACHSC